MTAQAVSQRVVTRRPRRDQRGDAVSTTSGPWRQAASGGVTVSWRGRLRQACWAVVLVALALAGLRLPAQAQLLRPFTVQFTNNKPGDIYIIGNTLLSCDPKRRPTALESLATDFPCRLRPRLRRQPLQAYQTCDPNIAKKGEGFIKGGWNLCRPRHLPERPGVPHGPHQPGDTAGQATTPVAPSGCCRLGPVSSGQVSTGVPGAPV